jgi:hypothetical protein
MHRFLVASAPQDIRGVIQRRTRTINGSLLYRMFVQVSRALPDRSK